MTFIFVGCLPLTTSDINRFPSLNSPLKTHTACTVCIRKHVHVLMYVFVRGGDLAPSLGGTEKRKNFRGPRFLNDDFSLKKFPFSCPKFLMTLFFSHRPGFF